MPFFMGVLGSVIGGLKIFTSYDDIAFGLMISGGYVFSGMKRARIKLKLWTITRN